MWAMTKTTTLAPPRQKWDARKYCYLKWEGDGGKADMKETRVVLSMCNRRTSVHACQVASCGPRMTHRIVLYNAVAVTATEQLCCAVPHRRQTWGSSFDVSHRRCMMKLCTAHVLVFSPQSNHRKPSGARFTLCVTHST